MDIMRGPVGPNYFRTLRIPVLAGREFTPQDAAGARPVAIVNQAFADRFWPHQAALGKRVGAQGDLFTVVGVVRNCNYQRLNEIPQPMIYLPMFQDFYHNAVIHVRVSGDPAAFTSALERTVHAVNADLPLYNALSLTTVITLASIGERIAGTLVGVFGLLALLLAGVGIYGVVSYTTRQRTHEIAIRMALGAQRAEVLRAVLGQGVLLTLTGLTVGIAMALALTRYLKSVLFGITPNDLWTYAAVTFLLCLVSVGACYIPARRAMKVDPLVALRYE
jgi:predicted permease